MKQCKFCDFKLNEEISNEFCSSCGIALGSEEIKIGETKDSSDLTFIDKIKKTYFQLIFRLNQTISKKTHNLIRARNLTENNLSFIQVNRLIFTPEEESSLNQQITELSKKIQSKSLQFNQGFLTNTDFFNSGDFYNVKINSKKLFSETKKTGLIQWRNSIKKLSIKNNQNINILNHLERFDTTVIKDVSLKDFEQDKIIRMYLQLKKLNEKVKKILEKPKNKNLFHEDVLEKIQTIYKTYSDYIKENKIAPSDISFGIKFGNWFKNTIENIKIISKNLKFSYYLFAGSKKGDLIKAKENLEKAKQMVVDFPSLIYNINKVAINQELTQKIELITNFKEETKEIISKSNELMKKFQFIDADSMISEYLEKLKQYKLIKQITETELQKSICSINMKVFTRLEEIENQFSNKDYLGSLKSMQELKKINKKNKITKKIIDSVATKIENLTNNIKKQRDEGQNNLRDGLVKLKQNLIENLNFIETKKILNKKYQFAVQQEYSDYIKTHSDFIKEFNQNREIKQKISDIKNLIEKENLGQASELLKSMNKKVSKSKFLVYSKLTSEIDSINNNLDEKINAEEEKIDKLIKEIKKIIDDEMDLSESKIIFQSIFKRISITGLNSLNSKLKGVTEKISFNEEARTEQLEIQTIFSNGDIKQADKLCNKLVSKVEKGVKGFQDLYSPTLKASVDLLKKQINAALKDGAESLQSDFDGIEGKIEKTLDFTEILELLTNYKIRSKRLGMNKLLAEIERLEIASLKNNNLMIELKSLEKKHDEMINFLDTLKNIKILINNSKIDKNLFDHVITRVNEFENKIQKAAAKRENRVKKLLKSIIENEVNKLDFSKALESLSELSKTARNLAVLSIKPEIKKYIEICKNHQDILANVEEVSIIAKSGKIIEARRKIEGLKTAISQYDGIIINPMRDKVDEVGKETQSIYKEEIFSIKEKLKECVIIVEDKRAIEIYDDLNIYLERAKYLNIEDTVKEIEDLIKLSHLQFDPEELKKLRKSEKKKKKISLEESKIASQSISEEKLEKETTIASFKKIHYDETDEIPEFDTPKERREYKRKYALVRKAIKYNPPKVNTNLNNSLRSSATRLQLQRYSNQINKPKEQRSKVCRNCGAEQERILTKFCYFCGKEMN